MPPPLKHFRIILFGCAVMILGLCQSTPAVDDGVPHQVPPRRSNQLSAGFGMNLPLPRDPRLPWTRHWWTSSPVPTEPLSSNSPTTIWVFPTSMAISTAQPTSELAATLSISRVLPMRPAISRRTSPEMTSGTASVQGPATAA